jgi:subtilase family serine protease
VPTCAAPDPEINLDVEWAHAIAPGAKIDLVVPPTNSFMDVDDGELYAIANGLGNTISGSYGSEELYTPEATLNEENLINQLAAVSGISANFATLDGGDFTFGYPASNPASVAAPASSPYATGVGGVTLALKSDNTMSWQTGWGTNQNPLVVEDTIFAPPSGYFDFGSGGGPSGFFSKPSFQKKLPGKQRLLPDISWLADPYTGGVIAISEPFTYPTIEYQVLGGTSLATPMFSGLWAIAMQEAGVPLGQAARSLYTLPEGTITDVVPHGAAHNVTGVVADSVFGTTSYTADELAGPLAGNSTFLSALWDYPLYQETFLLTFGTDSGLRTTTGWDNVTGLGTPNGKKFADYFNPARDK